MVVRESMGERERQRKGLGKEKGIEKEKERESGVRYRDMLTNG